MSRAANLDRRTRWILIGFLAILFVLALLWGTGGDEVSPATAACINDNGGQATQQDDGTWQVEDWAETRPICAP